MVDYSRRGMAPRSIQGILVGMMVAVPVWVAIFLFTGIL